MSKKKTIEEIEQAFNERNYILLSKEYINAHHKLEYICPKGHKGTISWNRFQSGLRCPICNSSKGEETIIKLLKELQVKFIHDKSIWKPFNNLRPDFFLPDYNLVIEFDGIQHFEPIEIFGGQEGFTKRQQKDNEKNIYCENNNIDILRIPYWEFNNITKIIKNKLKIN